MNGELNEQTNLYGKRNKGKFYPIYYNDINEKNVHIIYDIYTSIIISTDPGGYNFGKQLIQFQYF